MDLARHASVLWRFRGVTVAGIGLAIAIALLTSYKVTLTGITPRGSETWSATSSILVTQPGFPEGRVTLPQQQIDDAVTAGGQQASEKFSAPKDQVEFADPGRLAALGDLYSRFLTSDEVLRRVPERPAAGQVVASPFAGNQAGQLLPVIELKTMAPTGAMANRINVNTYKALLEYLEDRQAANQISTARRVELKLIVAPKVALVSGRKPTASVLAFLLVLLGTVAFTHLLEALRTRRQDKALASIEHLDGPGRERLEDERSDRRGSLDSRDADPFSAVAGPRSQR